MGARYPLFPAQLHARLMDYNLHQSTPPPPRRARTQDAVSMRVLMLGHRLRRWPNIKSALAQRLVFVFGGGGGGG